MANANILVENSDLPGARQAEQINTKLPVSLQGTAANLSVGGNLTVAGTLSAGSEMTTSQVITATSANAFAVGSAGTTNPALNVDTSGGATDVTGLNVNSNSAASGLALSVLSSGTNESGTLDAKGTGTFGINTVGTTSGLVTIGNSTSLAGLAVNGLINGTSASANALAIGLAGTTNPALQVDASTASSATGLRVKSAAAAGGVALSVISSGTNEPLVLNTKGSGQLQIQSSATGSTAINRGGLLALIVGSTTTAVGTQNSNPTTAQLLGGFIAHTSVTGAGTATLPIGSTITAGVPNASAGDSFTCIYANIGTQTVTITGATGTTVIGTAAIPAGKNAILQFVLLGGNAVSVYCTVSA